MHCTNCGSEIAPGDKFCFACGQPVSQPADPAWDAPVDETGEGTMFGPYRVVESLGRGDVSMAWRAWDTQLNRNVVVKEPFFVAGLDPQEHAANNRSFVQAGRTAQRLSHPNIVSVYAAGEFDGRPAIVSEYVEGVTLNEWHYPVGASTVLDVLTQVLTGLEYAHEQGLVHLGIKPDNIYVASDGTVKLANFGFAHTGMPEGEAKAVAAAHMSPEQAMGYPTDARSDIFSLGVVAYEMLTGRNPFGYDSADEATAKARVVNEQPADPEVVLGSVLPAQVKSALAASLQKDPARRPQSATEFKALLGISPAIQPTPAVQPTTQIPRVAPIPAAIPPTNPVNPPITPNNPMPQQPTPTPIQTTRAGAPSWLPYAIAGVACSLAAVAVVFAITRNPNPPTVVSHDAAEEQAATEEESAEQEDGTTEDEAAADGGSSDKSGSDKKDDDKKDDKSVTVSPTKEEKVEVKGQYPPKFTSASASSTLPSEYYKEYGTLDYSPSMVLDKDVTTAWNANHSSKLGVGETITITASTEQLVSGVEIVNGYPLKDSIYSSNPRPRELEVELSDGFKATLSLTDSYRSSQRFEFGGEHDVTWMKFKVKSIYQPSVKEYDTVCIAEITAF